FALDNPALFSLMFREERLDATRPALRDARRAAFEALSRSAGAGTRPGLHEIGLMTASWSLAHGFAVLAIDRRLAPLMRAAPKGTDLDELLEATLSSVSYEAEGIVKLTDGGTESTSINQ